MASNSAHDEFPDLSLWTSNSSLDLLHGGDMSYSSSDLSSARNSLSSHTQSLMDLADPPQFFNGYVRQSSKGDSPEESVFGYQLPSPLEDEGIMNPVAMDKDRRREQNRVAQRAFRERKESKLKQLEKRISEMKAEHRHLEKKYNNLHTAHIRLQSGLRILLDAGGTYDGEDTNSSRVGPDTKN